MGTTKHSIALDIFSDAAESIINTCILINRRFNNSSRLAFAKVSRNCENSIVINWIDLKRLDPDKAKFKKRLAAFIKKAVRFVCPKPDKNDMSELKFKIKTEEGSICIGKALLLIDVLNGLKVDNLVKRYGKEAMDEIIGFSFNPFQTEMMKNANIEAKKIIKDGDAECQKVKNEYNLAIEKLKSDMVNEIEPLAKEMDEMIDAAWESFFQE